MRVYYFDDSGDRGKDPNVPYLVVGGFGIDADQLALLRTNVTNAALRFGFHMRYPQELKFNHVGRSADNKPNKPHWMLRAGLDDRHRRRALVYTCLRAALQTPTVRVLAVAVNQKDTYGSKKPIELAMDPLFERISLDLHDHRTSGMVVMDEEQADDKSLRSAIRAGSYFMRYDRLIDTISFMPSEETPGIQVADLIAGAVGRYLNFSDHGYMRQVWPYIRSVGGRRDRYGIKLYPKGSCAEPAPQPVPWPAQDQRVHEYEMQAAGQPMTWHWTGEPSMVFPFPTWTGYGT